MLEEDMMGPAPSFVFVYSPAVLPTTIFNPVICFISIFFFSFPSLFVDEFHQALAEVIKVKDLDVQNFDGPLDFGVHAVPVLQGVIQVLLRVLDAALQVRIAHLRLLQGRGGEVRQQANRVIKEMVVVCLHPCLSRLI